MKLLLVSICVALLTSAALAGAKVRDPAACPLRTTGVPRSGDVQWAFTESAPPTGKHPAIRSSYTHGRGTWTSGRATGTACGEDFLQGGAQRNIVLSVSGAAKLSGHVTELGLLGVSLVLPVRVKRSDDAKCAAGTRGTVTLFASYYSVHRDSLALTFPAACADHAHRFTGSSLHVLITRHGAQVN